MSTLIEKSLASLMPKGEIAWQGMTSGSQREITDGISVQGERDRENGKKILKDFYPLTTTLFREWEETYGLPTGELLTDEQRKNRLNETWRRISPATFDGMNKIYELSGIPVVARPLQPGEDPRDLIAGGATVKEFLTVTGTAKTGQLSEFSRCGAFTIIPGIDGIGVIADGRPGTVSKKYITVCKTSRCGQLSTSSRCGNFEGNKITPPLVTIPSDPVWWPLIYVVESPLGDIAQIPEELKDAFIFLTLKNKPNFMWVITRVEYV